MKKPDTPPNEAARLKALRALDILDTDAEERFDRFTRLASRMFSVPTALVSLVDAERQWFKSRVGLEASETPREISFCGHAILSDEVFVVSDASTDERFADNPLVADNPHIRFYAGCPLAAPDGSRLGTLCLIDGEARKFTEEDRGLLRDLAHMVEDELAARALATMDELTGLSNRRGFLMVADKALAICERLGRPASLLFFDLDRFKAINDEFGHAEGDRALRDFAGLLLECFRDSDVVARMGGDEFCVLLTNASEQDLSGPLARLESRTADRNRAPASAYPLLYSVGVSAFDPARHQAIESLLDSADRTMYDRKRARRGERD